MLSKLIPTAKLKSQLAPTHRLVAELMAVLGKISPTITQGIAPGPMANPTTTPTTLTTATYDSHGARACSKRETWCVRCLG